ncbi:MAG: XamI family restriction endonuclease [Pseudomonadota bacterium]
MVDPSRLPHERIVAIFREKDLSSAFRYMAGPPISEDDLGVLARASLTPGRLAEDATATQRILGVIVETLDPLRFPWVAERRSPTQQERTAAVLASAALITAQRVATDRRNDAKKRQDSRVREYLQGLGLVETKPRPIRSLDDTPGRGHFSIETRVGIRKADIPVRLYDGRLMPIECKVSNSELNGVKRINNDAAVKARYWKEEFGRTQIVPTAVLSGVFKVINLLQPQEAGLVLFWTHKLDDLGRFIRGTKTG